MHFVDWLIVICPLLIVVFIGLKAQKYVKGVADFLAARRVAGRYVVAVSAGEAGMGLVSLVAIFEMYYNSGIAFNFWSAMSAPISIIMLLTGYCIYRYRETRAMTMGQFLEIRYNKPLRIFAGILQMISGVMSFAICPAIGARFLVYFCDLPINVEIFGYTFPTMMLIMAIFLGIAVFVATLGGQITVMVTDCVQGIFSYPMFAIIVIFLLFNYSWFDDIAPAMLDRPVGRSMLDPYDTSKLRDFNILYVLVGIFASIFNRMSIGAAPAYGSSALNAHEQKMGNVLGVWRNGFSFMMYVLLALVAFTVLNNVKFTGQAKTIRNDLTIKTMNDTIDGEEYDDVRKEILSDINKPEPFSEYPQTAQESLKKIGAMSRESQRDKAMLAIAQSEKAGHGKAQEFGTIYAQMRVPMALKHILPVGIMGVFCALCVFLLISTDTTSLHAWSSVIVQDIILPIRGKPLTPHQQLLLLRIFIVAVAFFAFIFSTTFGQIDFILMFFAIVGALWLGGAGVCIVGGLYWKRGTTAGAFTALIFSGFVAVSGFFLQRNWADHIYPWLVSNDLAETVGRILEILSGPFEPYIKWRMTPLRFPINSQEIFLFVMLMSPILYVVVSLLTCKKPFNMERMLHRGKYRREGEPLKRTRLTFRSAIVKLVGIDSQYTKGDKAIAWSVFLYAMLWSFGSFLVIIIWNEWFGRWPEQWWVNWYFIATVCVPALIAIVSTVWFTIGGVWDLRRTFARLRKKDINVLDDGRVISHVSADDVENVEKIDEIYLYKAHKNEKALRKALKKKGDIENLKNLDEHTEL